MLIRLALISLTLSLMLPAVGLASDLTDAVDDYNNLAAQLSDKWDDYVDDQQSSFDEWLDMTSKFRVYLLADTDGEVASTWSDFQDAQGLFLENSDGLDDSYDDYVATLGSTVAALKAVLTADALDSSFDAYVSGSSHFTQPDSPFVWWMDETCPDLDEWFEHNYVHLAVGSQGIVLPYEPGDVDELWHWWAEIFHWIHFGHWAHEHYDDGDEINHDRAPQFDELCDGCAQEPLEYTGCQVYFCPSVYSSGLCDDDLTEAQKAGWVRRSCTGAASEDLDHVHEAVEDYVHPLWAEDIVWFTP